MTKYRGSQILRVAVIAAAVMICSAPQPIAEQRPLVIRVLPPGRLAPTDLVVQAFVERNPRNRAVKFTVDSPAFYGSSTKALDGDQAPRALDVRFREVPAGPTLVQVTLIGATGDVAYDQVEMVIR